MRGGEFFRTTVSNLKAKVEYEFSVWMMNLCKITEKCPYPLLPNISIRLQTLSGETVAEFGIGILERVRSVQWSQYKGRFTLQTSEALILSMINSSPGGCGNDFAMDDIMFRECEKKVTLTAAKTKTSTPKKQPTTVASKPSSTTANKPARIP